MTRRLTTLLLGVLLALTLLLPMSSALGDFGRITDSISTYNGTPTWVNATPGIVGNWAGLFWSPNSIATFGTGVPWGFMNANTSAGSQATIGAWYKPNQNNANMELLGAKPTGSNCASGSVNGCAFAFDMLADGRMQASTWYTTNAGTCSGRASGDVGLVLQPNVWYYVTMTVSGANGIRIYVNGTLQASSATQGIGSLCGASNTVVEMGQSPNDSCCKMNASLDHVEVWNVELTGTQVNTAYTGGEPAGGNAVSRYEFEDPTVAPSTVTLTGILQCANAPYYDALSWTASLGATNYIVNSTDPWGLVTNYNITSPTTTLNGPAGTIQLNWTVTPVNWTSGLWGNASNQVSGLCPSGGLFTNLFGSGGAQNAADQTFGTSTGAAGVTALNLGFGIILIMMLTTAGWVITRHNIGAGAGATVGVFIAIAGGLIPLWVTLFLIGAGLALILTLRSRARGGGA